MRVVFATTHVPCGERSGGQVVSHAIVRALRNLGCAVTVLGYDDPSTPAPPSCCETRIVASRTVETSRARIRAAGWFGRALLSGTPYTSAKCHSPNYRRRLREIVGEQQPDLVIIDHIQMAWLLPVVAKSIPTLVVLHNAESNLYAQSALHRSDAFGRLLYHRESRKLREVERQIASAADRFWLLSESDRVALEPHMKAASFRVLTVMPEWKAGPTAEGASHFDIGLIGTWSWLPNANALDWFLESVLPHLPEGTTVHVAGAGAEWLNGRYPSVVYRGFVDDAAAFLGAAGVVAIPTQLGSGVETKTLAAIRSGRPIVATQAAIRGLRDPPGNVVLAERPADFARCLVDALASGRQADAESAKAWCDRRHADFVRAVADELGGIQGRWTAPAESGEPAARDRGGGATPAMTSPLVSVVVPTHNRVKYLAGLLDGLDAQDFPQGRWEVILVDDGSTDATADYLGQVAARHWNMHIETIRIPVAGGSSGARNVGAARAGAPILLFLDDDMIASPRLLADHLRRHEEAVDVVIGRFGPPATPRTPWIGWEDHQIAKHFQALRDGSEGAGPRDLYSGNVSMSASVFAAAGGFDARLLRLNDIEFGYRLQAAGARFSYCASAYATHLGEHSLEKWIENARLSGEAERGLSRPKAEVEHRFQSHRWPTRMVIRLCARHPALEAGLIRAMAGAGRVSHAIGARKASIAAYSAVYNLAFWMSAFGKHRGGPGARNARDPIKDPT